MIKTYEIDFNNNSGNFIKAENLEESMRNIIEPYVNSKKKDGFFYGCNNKKIYYQTFILSNAKASIVISHGHREFAERYNELIYYFLNSGYSVFIMEHRGHARSEHLGIDATQIHVEKFDYYLDDMKKFLDTIVVKSNNNKPLFLFAHSMGGGIGAGFLEKYPEYFKSAILHAPMLKINTGSIPFPVAFLLSRIMKVFKKEMKYIPGQKPYSGQEKNPEKASDCIERYKYTYDKVEENVLFQHGGSSVNWYLESSKAIKKIIKKENAEKVKIPVLLMQPQNDFYIHHEAHDEFAKNAPNCIILKINGSKHESFNEDDNIAFPVFNAILEFFADNINVN